MRQRRDLLGIRNEHVEVDNYISCEGEQSKQVLPEEDCGCLIHCIAPQACD